MHESRREFLRHAGVSSALSLLHWHAALGDDDAGDASGGPGAHRLRSLRLETAVPIEEMHAYYRDLLGLPVRGHDERTIAIEAGATLVTFERIDADDPRRPFYHFAFNIPENKIRAARDWQLERTPIFGTPEHQRDPAYPDEVRHFRSWNAHSVFFADPAGNVLEYIARHDLGNDAPGPFGTKDILYASEIAFVVDDVATYAESLKGTFGLDQYRGASSAFAAIGDERGLLLVFRRGRNLGAGADRDYRADVFSTQVAIHAGEAAVLAADGYPYRVEGVDRAMQH